MHVAEIFLKDWRNISELKFFPDTATNIFLGQNAQGKTNILEAINFASLLKSRAGKEAELIRWEQAAALARIKFFKADIAHELAIEISVNRPRRILLDGDPIRPRELIGKRLASVEKLNSLANFMHKKISAQKETLSISYDMCGENTAEKFFELLRARRADDIRNGLTGRGAHRDDLKFFINGRELKLYGSQGQLRTATLALKLSELQFLKSETGEYPLLLLDDVMSELDAERRDLLLKFLRGEKIQTLITATDRAYFPPQISGKIFSVKAGALIE